MGEFRRYDFDALGLEAAQDLIDTVWMLREALRPGRFASVR